MKLISLKPLPYKMVAAVGKVWVGLVYSGPYHKHEEDKSISVIRNSTLFVIMMTKSYIFSLSNGARDC